jgi:hypothetical protein
MGSLSRTTLTRGVGALLALGLLAAGGEALVVWAGFEGWHGTLPRNLSQSHTATYPAVALSGEGRPWAIWTDDRTDDTDPKDVYYAVGEVGGFQWAAPERVAPADEYAHSATLVVSGTTAWVSWAEGFDGGLFHAVVTPSDTETMTVPTDHPREAAGLAQVRADDWLYLAFHGAAGSLDKADILLTWRSIGSTAWPAATVVHTSTLNGAYYPDLAVGVEETTHTLYLVWEERVPQQKSSIQYRQGVRTAGGIAWTVPVTLSVGITRAVLPSIGLATDGDLHVVWGEEVAETSRRVYYIRRDAGAEVWTPATLITPDPVQVNVLNPTVVEPALAIGPEPDTVCVAWHGCQSSPCVEEVWLSCSDDDGESWFTPTNISRSPDTFSLFPAAAFDPAGNLHILWQESEGDSTKDYAIFHARSLPNTTYLPVVMRGK